MKIAFVTNASSNGHYSNVDLVGFYQTNVTATMKWRIPMVLVFYCFDWSSSHGTSKT